MDLPAGLDEQNRPINNKELAIYLGECEKSARSVMLRIKDALKILEKLRGRYRDIESWVRKALEVQDDTDTPQRLRVLLLEANEWLRVIIGTLRGILNYWEVAQDNHRIFRGEQLDAVTREALNTIWDTRSKVYDQWYLRNPDEPLPLTHEEIKVISLCQQMDEWWYKDQACDDQKLEGGEA